MHGTERDHQFWLRSMEKSGKREEKIKLFWDVLADQSYLNFAKYEVANLLPK